MFFEFCHNTIIKLNIIYTRSSLLPLAPDVELLFFFMMARKQNNYYIAHYAALPRAPGRIGVAHQRYGGGADDQKNVYSTLMNNYTMCHVTLIAFQHKSASTL